MTNRGCCKMATKFRTWRGH